MIFNVQFMGSLEFFVDLDNFFVLLKDSLAERYSWTQIIMSHALKTLMGILLPKMKHREIHIMILMALKRVGGISLLQNKEKSETHWLQNRS